MNYRELWFSNNESDHGWYTCAKCGKKIRKADADIDHIVPQKHGGEDKLYNLQCLCKHCNRSKQASMEDTLPDLAKTNGKRLVKAVKKNARFVKLKVVEGVKSVAKKDTAKKDTAKKDTAKKDTAKKDTAKKDTAKKDTVKKDSVKKDTAKKDTAKKDTAKKDTVKKDTAKKDTAKKDTVKKDTVKKDTVKKDTAKKDSAKKSTNKKK